MVELKIDCQKIEKEIVRFLQEEFKGRKKIRAILGVSGGVDSATVAILCKKAGLELRKVFMPYGRISQQLPNYSIKIDITSIVDRQAKEVGKHIPLDKIDKGGTKLYRKFKVLY